MEQQLAAALGERQIAELIRKSAVLAASADGTAAQRQFAVAEDALCLERLRRDGVAVVPVEEIDMAAFRAAVAAAGL